MIQDRKIHPAWELTHQVLSCPHTPAFCTQLSAAADNPTLPDALQPDACTVVLVHEREEFPCLC